MGHVTICKYLKILNFHPTEERHLECEVEIQRIIKNQTEIGWNKFCQGFIHTNLAKSQENYYRSNGKTTSGNKWSGKISAFWIELSHKIWLERNDAVHNEEDENNRTAVEVRMQVRQLYDKKHLLAERDRELFDISLERRLLQPTYILEIWINSIGPLVDRCIEIHNEETRRQNRTIHEFYTNENRNIQEENNDTTQEINSLDEQMDLHFTTIRSRTGDSNENLNTSGTTFVVTQVETRE